MITNLFLKPFSKALNKAIQTDPASMERLKKLSGTQFKIIFTDIDLPLNFEANESTIHCFFDKDCVSHVTVKGTVFSFIQSFINGNDAAAAKKFSLHIEGDTHIAQQWQALFSNLDIDWQQLLGDKIGEQPAFHFLKAANKAKSVLLKTKQKIMSDTGEYLQYEKQLITPKPMIQNFSRDVSVLQQDTDRLEARIQRLKRAKHA